MNCPDCKRSLKTDNNGVTHCDNAKCQWYSPGVYGPDSQRINVTGMQGSRTYLTTRGVNFPVHNPTVGAVRAKIKELRTPHKRHKGHKGCGEAADLLQTLLDREVTA